MLLAVESVVMCFVLLLRKRAGTPVGFPVLAAVTAGLIRFLTK